MSWLVAWICWWQQVFLCFYQPSTKQKNVLFVTNTFQIVYCEAKQKKNPEVSQKQLLVFSTQKLLSNNHGKKAAFLLIVWVSHLFERKPEISVFFSAAQKVWFCLKKKLCFPFPLFLCYFFTVPSHAAGVTLAPASNVLTTNQVLIWSTALQWDNAHLRVEWLKSSFQSVLSWFSCQGEYAELNVRYIFFFFFLGGGELTVSLWCCVMIYPNFSWERLADFCSLFCYAETSWIASQRKRIKNLVKKK